MPRTWGQFKQTEPDQQTHGRGTAGRTRAVANSASQIGRQKHQILGIIDVIPPRTQFIPDSKAAGTVEGLLQNLIAAPSDAAKNIRHRA
jgi:hypothetical protein